MTLFRGLCAFPITPTEDGARVDAAALRALVQRLHAGGADSIGLLGSTGGFAFLARSERRRAVSIAADTLGGRLPLLVGIGALRTDDAIALGQDAREAGADAVLLPPMSYTPLSEDEVFEHVAAVADTVGLPLCVYNNPATTHFTITPALLARLSGLPFVAAVKNPAPPPTQAREQLADLRRLVPDGFSVGCSVDADARAALIAGADAWYSVAGGLFPVDCAAILAAASQGQADKASALDARLRPLWDLFATHTSLRVVHEAARQLGLCHAPLPRPLLPLSDAARQKVRDTLNHLGLS